MDEFLVFLSENWKWLVALGLAIAEILFVVLKKRVKVFDSIKEIILSILPSYINVAEQLSPYGEEKKEFVFESVVKYLTNKFDNFDVNSYVDFIKDSIESILSTPQKKGVK